MYAWVGQVYHQVVLVLGLLIFVHELGHFLGDYFRVYDNYYKLPDGTIRSEDLAYEFDGYFEGYLMRLLMARRQAERERERE